ncbi:(S)-sulfolactate dehydrogenase [Hyphomicrobiales bacterium]|nr:(S)-sulfolactate dehydrogenase [Hyphomicrobiales bacterium]CAH1695527.1 (S)-sulfolactate dehydrogenase [Hyphomicrobiales bacterium]
MIVISEFMDEEAIRSGLDGFEVLYDPSLVDRPDDLAVVIGQADALIVRNRTQVRGALLEAARHLKAVGRLGVGLDNIDVAACKARGIAVYPASGANDTSVAEYVIATAMLLLRGAYGASAEVASGAWPRNAVIGREIAGKRLGLIGFGAIARETAKRAAALGMTIAAYDPYLPPSAEAWTQPWGHVEPQPLNTLLAEADVVSLHVPLTDETRGLIDGAAISRMKKGALVINAARGGVVDEGAIAAALRAGHLGGAALDVFEEEPLTAGLGSVFASTPNLILTPHIAGVTVESNVRVSWVTVDNIRRHLAGA